MADLKIGAPVPGIGNGLEPVRAVRLVAPESLEEVDLNLPPPRQGEALVSIEAVGLCGSDLHWYRQGSIGEATIGDGLVLGHEAAGVVVSGSRAGERVVIDPAVPCEVCPICIGGSAHLCRDGRFAGHHPTNGALSTHMVWPESNLVPLPGTVPVEQATLLEPLGIALHAINLAGGVQGLRVGVLGAGPIGLLLVAALRVRGATRIVVTEPLPHRLQAAEALGATAVIPATEDEVEREALVDSGEIDIAIETSGTDSGLGSAIVATRPGGRVVLVGIPEADRTTYAAAPARRKELTLALCRRMASSDLVKAVGLVASGQVCLEALVTHIFGLERANQAFAVLEERQGLKVVVTPNSP